jgi:hypothetical protein
MPPFDFEFTPLTSKINHPNYIVSLDFNFIFLNSNLELAQSTPIY